MPLVNHAVQYYLFMKWFKNNQPRLYSQYKLHILVPTQSYKIEAEMDYIEPQDKKALQDAIDEYYTTIAD